MGSSDPIIPPEVQLAKEIHVLTAQRADVATEDSTFDLTTSNFSSYRATTNNQQHLVIHQPSATDQPSIQFPTTVTARTMSKVFRFVRFPFQLLLAPTASIATFYLNWHFVSHKNLLYNLTRSLNVNEARIYLGGQLKMEELFETIKIRFSLM